MVFYCVDLLFNIQFCSNEITYLELMGQNCTFLKNKLIIILA